MKYKRVLLLFILAVYGHYHTQAQTTATAQQDTVIHIKQIEVTARHTNEIVPAQMLQGKELERLSAHSVADALRYFSGVQIKDYGGVGGLKTVNVRSMGSQHVGVFYDGIQIGNAQNGTVDLGKFSLDNMELVSIYNGQKSDIFQSARDFASASALYMVTRRPYFEDDKKDNLNFKIKTGSFDLIDVSTLWEHKFNDLLSSSANVQFVNSSGKYKFRYDLKDGYDTTEVRRNGDVMFVRAEAALFGKIRRGEWQAKGYFYNSVRGYPGAAVKEDYGISLQNEDRQADRNYFIQTSLRQKLASYYSYRVQAKFADDYMNYIMPPGSTVKSQNLHYYQKEIYLTAANLFTINNWWSANLSCDFQWNSLDAYGDTMFDTNFVIPRRYTVLTAAATSIRLKKLSVQGSLLYTYVHDISMREFDIAKDKNIVTPTLIASYTPVDDLGLDIRAFYKKIFRMPTFNDLYYVQIGNRFLKPEYTTQYNLGVNYSKQYKNGFLSVINCSVDAYFNKVKDKIVALPAKGQTVWTMLNLGYVEILGVDLSINPQFDLGNVQLNTRLTYTYQEARDFTQESKDGLGSPTINSTFGDQIPYVPWHSGSLVLSATYRRWDFNYSFIYTGERYRVGGNIPINYIEPWYTSDVSVSRDILLRKSQLRVTAEINNIFNQQYEVIRWYPMPGINFKIILSLTL